MNSYEVFVQSNKLQLHFLTTAKTSKSAVRHLVDNSYDFDSFKDDEVVRITIKKLSKETKKEELKNYSKISHKEKVAGVVAELRKIAEENREIRKQRGKK